MSTGAEGTITYWARKTLVEIRESRAYQQLPTGLHKTKLRKSELCCLLGSWCRSQGYTFPVGSLEFWQTLPLWALHKSSLFLTLAAEKRVSRRTPQSTLCQILAAACAVQNI